MTKLERARATMACMGTFRSGCELTENGPITEVCDHMQLGDSVEERHEIIASLILDGEDAR